MADELRRFEGRFRADVNLYKASLMVGYSVEIG